MVRQVAAPRVGMVLRAVAVTGLRAAGATARQVEVLRDMGRREVVLLVAAGPISRRDTVVHRLVEVTLRAEATRRQGCR
jgi:hypothetical protein